MDVLVAVSGVAAFAWWLLHTSLGRQSLAGSKPRRNCMVPVTPVLLFLVWMLGGGLLLSVAAHAARTAAPWRQVFWGQLAAAVGSLGTIVLVLIVAKLDFARGVKGLGLRLRTAPKDLAFAVLHLLAVWPLILAAMSLTLWTTKMWYGPEYRIPPHQALKLISQAPALPLEVLLVVLAVVIAPVMEEMLFRGLFQTTIRSYTGRPWLAIGLTSILFALIHEDPSHWPSLFALALGLGYAYEKSGSLLRSIFMHALFNSISIVAVLTQGPG
jgi:membrane protease YdiL (CAAX protease family)